MSLRCYVVPVLSCLAMLAAATTNAALLVHEDFSHPDGDLVGQTPTPGPGATWAAHSSGGTNPIQVTSGAAVLQQASGGREDANTSFATRSDTDTTYMRFDFSLPSGQTVDPDENGLYFAHLKDSGTAFRARVGVLSPTDGGDYKFAINASGSMLVDGTLWPSELSFDTTYTLVASYNAATGESKLWIDPVNESSSSVSNSAGGATGTLIEAFALRQSNDYTGSQIIDNLCVATSFNEALNCVPEPAAMFILLAGLPTLGAIRRRSLRI
jgi:hypothetical protein